jgi:hypothetical protein
MALTGTGAEPVRSALIFGFSIDMKSGDQMVRVRVRDDALQKLACSDNDVGRLSQFLTQYRSEIEEVASRKHSADQIENDGSVCVTPADV